MVFVLGVVMAILGLAFMVLNDFHLSERIQLKRWQRIFIGLLLLSFFPIYFAIFPWIQDVQDDYRFFIPWGVMGFCLLLTLLFFLLFTKGSQPGPDGVPQNSPTILVDPNDTVQDSTGTDESEDPFQFT